MKKQRQTASGLLRGRRTGITLIELLVAIVILGVLVALILPAVLRAREAARRAQCANNLRQLAMAVTQFESVHRCLPSSGTYGVLAISGHYVIDYFQPKRSWVVDVLPFIDRKDIFDGWTFDDPDPTDLLLFDHPNWNAASPATSATDLFDGIVGVAIVSGDIDPANRDNAALSHKHIALLVCPGNSAAVDQGGGLSYVCNSGYAEFDGTLVNTNYVSNWSCTQTDWDGDGTTCAVLALNDPEDAQIARRMGLFWAGCGARRRAQDDIRVTIASITDGTSNTIMLTENVNGGFMPAGGPADAFAQGDFTWAFPWTLATGFVVSTVDICPNGQFGVCNWPGKDLRYEVSNTTTAIGGINRSLEPNVGRAPFPSSCHNGVINVAFCDGSTRAISARIDGSVYCRLISPQGGHLPRGAQINIGRADAGLWQEPLSASDY